MQIGSLIRIRIVDKWEMAVIGEESAGLLRIYWLNGSKPSWFYRIRLKRLLYYKEMEVLCT